MGNDLHRRARERIADGRLPARQTVKTFGGYGLDATCSLCDRRIARDEMEYEVETTSAGEARNYRFHLTCHATWLCECRDLEVQARLNVPGASVEYPMPIATHS
jgi:hypothetical protein